MNKAILILTGVGVAGILIIASIVTFQFAQQQDDRSRLIQAQQQALKSQQEQQMLAQMTWQEKTDCEEIAGTRALEKATEGFPQTPYPHPGCELYLVEWAKSEGRKPVD